MAMAAPYVSVAYQPECDRVQQRSDALAPQQVALLARLLFAPVPLLLPPGVLSPDLADLIEVGAQQRANLTGFGYAVSWRALSDVLV